MQTTLDKIQGFSQFQRGWSFGEGTVFAQNTLDKARQLAKTAHTLGFDQTDAFPGLNGEIMVTVYRGCEYWEFTIQPAETITFVYEKDEKTVLYEEGLPFEFAMLPSGYIAEQQTTPSGDVCHYNILHISDKAARDLFIQRHLTEFQICEHTSSLPLTTADLTKQT